MHTRVNDAWSDVYLHLPDALGAGGMRTETNLPLRAAVDEARAQAAALRKAVDDAEAVLERCRELLDSLRAILEYPSAYHWSDAAHPV